MNTKEEKAREYRLKTVLNTERYLEGGSNIEKAYIAGWDAAVKNLANNQYEIVTWPDIQDLMNLEGFEDNSYLINDDKGIDKFGSSAYFVNVEWYNKMNI